MVGVNVKYNGQNLLRLFITGNKEQCQPNVANNTGNKTPRDPVREVCLRIPSAPALCATEYVCPRDRCEKENENSYTSELCVAIRRSAGG